MLIEINDTNETARELSQECSVQPPDRSWKDGFRTQDGDERNRVSVCVRGSLLQGNPGKHVGLTQSRRKADTSCCEMPFSASRGLKTYMGPPSQQPHGWVPSFLFYR